MSNRPLSSHLLGVLALASLFACGDNTKSPSLPYDGPERVSLPKSVYLLNLPGTRVTSSGRPILDLNLSGLSSRTRLIGRQGDYRRSYLLKGKDALGFHELEAGAARLKFGVTFGDGKSSADARATLTLRSSRPNAQAPAAPLWSQEFAPDVREADRQWIDIEVDLPEGAAPGLSFAVEKWTGTQTPAVAVGSLVLEYSDAKIRAFPNPPSSVVVVLIDTLRADHLNPYGYSEATSPQIAQLAEESIVFTDASSTSSWTKASVASLLTGRYPSFNRVEDYTDQLPENVPTLADSMRTAGFRTAAFGFNTWVFNPKFGIATRFDQRFEVLDRVTERETRSDVIIDQAADWLEQNGDEPFLLYVHTIDPHAPYLPTPEFKAQFANPEYSGPVDEWVALAKTVGKTPYGPDDLSAEDLDQVNALYDAEIRFNDEQIGALIDRLQKLGLWEECLFVLASDHGEEFLEHGRWGHGGTLYQEQLHVPLMIKPPLSSGLKPTRLDMPVSLVDVVPTVLQLLGVRDHGMRLDGQSLAELTVDPKRWKRSFVLAELDRSKNEITSVREGDWKLIDRLPPRPAELLFNLASDPTEQDNRIEDGPAEVTERLRALIAAHRSLERQSGIYLVVTGDGTEQEFRLTVRSEDEIPSVRMSESEKSDVFVVRTPDSAPNELVITSHLNASDRRDKFRIGSGSAGAPLQLEVHLNGQSAPSGTILLGPQGKLHDLSEPLYLRLTDSGLVSTTEELEIKRSASTVHVLVIPAATSQLSEAEAESLHALGYYASEGED